MPKKSGLEVLRWIREQPQFRSLPVLILTSSSRQEDLGAASKLGADDYLLKPANPLELVELVEQIHLRWLATSSQAATGTSAAVEAISAS